ncbi:unnamed protein product [marine sediment metagenome]|uniref:Uncharacterized protein n=2 Tax=marine sediment metagenome TaxID=412755 RepID=X1AKJ6_9ZZZZ
MKWLEKYRPKKLTVNNILPKVNIFLLPDISERIPENRLASKSPKALKDRVEPIVSKLTLKPSASMGIKGPKIDPPNPNKKNCI